MLASLFDIISRSVHLSLHIKKIFKKINNSNMYNFKYYCIDTFAPGIETIWHIKINVPCTIYFRVYNYHTTNYRL